MTNLLSAVLKAHGGTERWNQLATVTATIVSDGELFAAKGLPQDLQPRRMTVDMHKEHASVRPFGAPEQRSDFTPDRIAIERADGTVVAERFTPRASFGGHTWKTPWDPLDRAYFNGYALWTYLTTPFFATMNGMGVEEAEPWNESSTERWRHLRVTSRTTSQAIAPCRTSTSGTTICSGATTTTLTSPAASRPRSTSTTSMKQTESSSRPSVARTSAGPTGVPTTITSWSVSTCAMSTTPDSTSQAEPWFLAEERIRVTASPAHRRAGSQTWSAPARLRAR